jgi:hypothetical protein
LVLAGSVLLALLAAWLLVPAPVARRSHRPAGRAAAERARMHV